MTENNNGFSQNQKNEFFQRTKLFGGQNFRQQVRFSAVMSAEILSDKVSNVKKITWATWQKITSLACTACWSSGMILA